MLRALLRIAGLGGILFVLMRLPIPGLRPVDVLDAPLAWLARAFLDAAVLDFLASRSRLKGIRLGAVLFGAFYGITLLSLLDAAVFAPGAVSAATFVEAALVAAIFAPLVARLPRPDLDPSTPAGQAAPWPCARGPWGWTWRLAALSFCYVVLYVLFGLLVFTPLARALAPQVLETYAAQQPPPWVLPFQAMRGLLFVAVALPLVRWCTGGWLRAGLCVGLAYGGLMAADLLIPTPLIPPAMRAAHFVEVFAENFLFGWAVARLLRGAPEPAPGPAPAAS